MKPKFPLTLAGEVADELWAALKPECEPGYCAVAGSVRRRKPLVGDIEILYVPHCEMSAAAGEMFEVPANRADAVLVNLLANRRIEARINALGHTTWGGLIKLARHCATGIPVDFFTATKENWFNYLVCRTGPAESNLSIATAARARGWKWEPYSSGFVSLGDPADRAAMTSERAVFEFVGLQYQEPERR